MQLLHLCPQIGNPQVGVDGEGTSAAADWARQLLEAFCKTLTARLKGSGMRWDRLNAEAMMALAALEHGNLWKHCWALQLSEAA